MPRHTKALLITTFLVLISAAPITRAATIATNIGTVHFGNVGVGSPPVPSFFDLATMVEAGESVVSASFDFSGDLAHFIYSQTLFACESPGGGVCDFEIDFDPLSVGFKQLTLTYVINFVIPIETGKTFSDSINFQGVGTQLNAVPLPAALPLFAGGLGLLGLIGWRRKRMAAA